MGRMRLGIDAGRATTVAVLVPSDGGIAAQATVRSAASLGGSLRAVLAALPRQALADVALVALTGDFPAHPADLTPAAVLRISAPAHAALAPVADWPADAALAVDSRIAVVSGGTSLTGHTLGRLDRAAVAEFARRVADQGVRDFAVAAAGAPTVPGPELEAAEIITEQVPGAAITLSHEIGRIGLRERESAAVLNAVLRGRTARLCDEGLRALNRAGLRVPLFVARNAGGLVSTEYLRRYPVIGTASAVASALRGGALLAGADRAVVIDAAAAETRCGAVRGGEVERAGGDPSGLDVPAEVGAASAARLPFGGSSLIGASGVPGTSRRHGFGVPVHYGGGRPTVTDAGLVAGMTHHVDTGRSTGRVVSSAGLPPGQARELVRRLQAQVEQLVERVMEGAPDAQAVATGGAAWLAPGTPEPWAPAAAAFGAASAEAVVEVERVGVATGRSELDSILALAAEEALARALAAGAAPDAVRIVSASHAPVAYLPEGVHRITVRAAGTPSAGHAAGAR